ncbi:MAG: hypothetical protein ACI8WT_003337 [Clostridium sp.]|jgi:hypothetical protein
MEGTYSVFFTLTDYLRSQKHLNKSQVTRNLVEFIINKII